jgi:hypothetical protein
MKVIPTAFKCLYELQANVFEFAYVGGMEEINAFQFA